jgi:tetratricopeptide (TPR) repeat protein
MKDISKIGSELIYSDYKEISELAFREKVSFYEKNKELIQSLDFKKYFEIKLDYADALFNTGLYYRYIGQSHDIIAESIQYNISTFKNKDIYKETLFKKAAAHHNVYEIEKAEHIIKELIKMDPNDRSNRSFLFRCLNKKKSRFNRTTRAVSVVFFLSAALVSAIEILIINNFFPQISVISSFIRNAIFVSGLVIFGTGELWNIVKIKKEIKSFMSAIKK